MHDGSLCKWREVYSLDRCDLFPADRYLPRPFVNKGIQIPGVGGKWTLRRPTPSPRRRCWHLHFPALTFLGLFQFVVHTEIELTCSRERPQPALTWWESAPMLWIWDNMNSVRQQNMKSHNSSPQTLRFDFNSKSVCELRCKNWVSLHLGFNTLASCCTLCSTELWISRLEFFSICSNPKPGWITAAAGFHFVYDLSSGKSEVRTREVLFLT